MTDVTGSAGAEVNRADTEDNCLVRPTVVSYQTPSSFALSFIRRWYSLEPSYGYRAKLSARESATRLGLQYFGRLEVHTWNMYQGLLWVNKIPIYTSAVKYLLHVQMLYTVLPLRCN